MTKTVPVRTNHHEYALTKALLSAEAELHDAFEDHPELSLLEELGLVQLLTWPERCRSSQKRPT